MGRWRTTDPKLGDSFRGCLYPTAGALFRRIDATAAEAVRTVGVSPSHALEMLRE